MLLSSIFMGLIRCSCSISLRDLFGVEALWSICAIYA